MTAVAFLDALKTKLEEWNQLPNFDLQRFDVAPVESDSSELLREFPLNLLSRELEELYQCAASSCVIEFDVRIPDDFFDSADSEWLGSTYFSGGFSMMSLSDIIACKTGLDDYVRGELHGNQESDIHSVIETLSKTVPLQWDSPESDALVWVAENAHLASGIYLISGCRTIFPDEWVKLTGSFHDLLRFLEGNAYPIPEHSVLEPFLSSDGVIQRPDLQDKVVSMMKRVIPSE